MSNSFGEFDPRFLGISLAVTTRKRWDLLSKYAFGPETLSKSKAARLHDDDFLEHVSCLTVLAHEIRHFHDYVLSIHGSRMTQARCALAFNVIMLLAGLYSDARAGANLLPAPLSLWCRMSQEERDSYLDEQNAVVASSGRQFIAPRMPFLSAGGDLIPQPAGGQAPAERVSLAVQACSQAQRRLYDLEALPEGVQPRGGFGPTHLWEASAVLVQCQEILKATGESALNRFISALMAAPGNRYGVAIRWIYTLFENSDIEADTQTMLSFVLWCLLGDPYNNGKYASPLVRYAELGAILVKKGRAALASSVTETFELWDRLTGNESTLAALGESASRDELFREFLAQKVQETGMADEDSSFADLLELFSQFGRARRHLIDQVLAVPEKYSSPGSYLDSLPDLSAPPVKLVMERQSAAFRVPGKFEDDSWHLYAGREVMKTGEKVGLIVGPPVTMPGSVHITRDAAFAAYTQFILSDILFGPDVVDVPQSDWENTENALLDRSMILFRLHR